MHLVQWLKWSFITQERTVEINGARLDYYRFQENYIFEGVKELNGTVWKKDRGIEKYLQSERWGCGVKQVTSSNVGVKQVTSWQGNIPFLGYLWTLLYDFSESPQSTVRNNHKWTIVQTFKFELWVIYESTPHPITSAYVMSPRSRSRKSECRQNLWTNHSFLEVKDWSCDRRCDQDKY